MKYIMYLISLARAYMARTQSRLRARDYIRAHDKLANARAMDRARRVNRARMSHKSRACGTCGMTRGAR